VADVNMPWRFIAATEWVPYDPLHSTEPDPNEVQPGEIRPAPRPVQYPGLRRKAFAIGPEVYHFEYEEPGIMKDRGTFWGVVGSYTYRDWVPASPEESPSPDKSMFRAEVRLARGEVDYEGSLMDGTPYTVGGIDDFVFEGRLLLGADWLRGQTLDTLYVGIGYRYLNDDTSFDPAGYERESTYLYVPVGYRFDSSHEVGWSFGFGAEFDLLIMGNQRSHLSDYDPTQPDIDNHQNSGHGYRASVKLQHKGKKAIFIVEPFFRYWDIDDSEVEYGVYYEPANETTEYGIQLVWVF
jgi:hypothetical protein